MKKLNHINAFVLGLIILLGAFGTSLTRVECLKSSHVSYTIGEHTCTNNSFDGESISEPCCLIDQYKVGLNEFVSSEKLNIKPPVDYPCVTVVASFSELLPKLKLTLTKLNLPPPLIKNSRTILYQRFLC
ncbi:MAG: hypothetical protein ACPGEG_00530 [Salibacteraceae bacterium]